MKLKILCLITIISFNNIFSQTKLTLSDAIKIGLKNNYNLRISNKNVEISRRNNSWGTAGRFPTIDLVVNSINRYDNNDSEIITNNLIPSVQLNWVLFNGFQIFHTKSLLEDQQKLSEGLNAVQVENTIKAIILSYFDVVLQKEKLNVFEELEVLSKDRYNRMKTGQELGNAVTYEVLQAKTSWLEDRSNFLSQKLNYDNSVRALNLLIGEKTDKNYSHFEEFKIELKEYSFEDLKERMAINNKNLKNQYLNEMISEREIDIARSGIFPKLIFNAGYDYTKVRRDIRGVAIQNTNSYDYYGNLTLKLNIFNGFNTRRALEIAKIKNEISKIKIEEIKHSLDNSLIQLLELYNIQKELLNVADENVNSTKLNLQISEEKFKNGVINSFNYRDVQLVYLNASLRKLNAIYNLIKTDTELARLTGSIITEE
ncbi:MAG: hypothetical protein CR986_00610 [Ignavibacteriae bacterium]|nr:MAG: hypothetical protein CR986_00610 [Ignavibacteriota bacterium]